MKILLKMGILILILLAVTSCKEKQSVEVNTPSEVKNETTMTADIADVEFGDGLIGKIWHNYLEIKFALSNSDAEQVQQTADSMAETFDGGMEELKSLALQISNTEDVEAQRLLFAQLSKELGPLFEKDLNKGTIYKKYCPMAFEGEGAYWYADVKEISNPYFGEKMLRCGSIEKTISK